MSQFDSFNNQLGLDRDQLLDEFFLEGQNHANGYNFGYYTFLCCYDCLLASNVQIATLHYSNKPLDMIQCGIIVAVDQVSTLIVLPILPSPKAPGFQRQGPFDFMGPAELIEYEPKMSIKCEI